MKKQFKSEQFGLVTIREMEYAKGGLAVQLTCPMEGHPEVEEPLTRLSTYLEGTARLPKNCFYAKLYGENQLIAEDTAASGWFKPRPELKTGFSGHCIFGVWELLEEQGEGFDLGWEEEQEKQEKRFPRIEDWYITPIQDSPYQPPEMMRQAVGGKVYGRQDQGNWPDGCSIRTSAIDKVWEEGEKMLVKTASGSTYELGKVDPEYEKAYAGAVERVLNAWKGKKEIS